MQAFAELQDIEDPDRVSDTRSDLYEYCKLDTLGMVRILEELESKSRRSHEPNQTA